MERHTVPACDLDRPRHHHSCAGRGHLEHLFVRDLRELQRVGDDAGVGREHAFDVRVDLARPAECRRQRDRSRVGAAAAERRHLELGGHALEAGDQHDLVSVELGISVAVVELVLGVTGSQAGVAHFAHLGGMLGGALMLLYWRASGSSRSF